MAELSKLTSKEAVLQAIAEADRMGREKFLKKYGFGKARSYYLRVSGKEYDSKAIVAVAFGFQYPDAEPLTWKTFSGGEGAAALALRKLGFVVGDAAKTLRPLILAENEVSAGASFDWKDVTGERYHFPNAYKNKIVPGARFIYYKGARRNDGSRAVPEYFGSGTIGSVYSSPDTVNLPSANRQWIADIAEYQPFSHPVPFRDNTGLYLESGTKAVATNYFGTGVRAIDHDGFHKILSLGLAETQSAAKTDSLDLQLNSAPPSPLVQSEGSLLKPPERSTPSARTATSSRRPTKRAKEIGDAAERLFFDWLCAGTAIEKRDKIRWVAQDGETPGYDIEDASTPGRTIGYEVKGTTGPIFGDFEITANELRAARDLGSRYGLVFVVHCLSIAPKFQVVWDPASLLDEGKWSATPTAFRIAFR